MSDPYQSLSFRKGRTGHASVVMPKHGIILIGGTDEKDNALMDAEYVGSKFSLMIYATCPWT